MDELLLAGILLSQGINKQFNEYDLSKVSDLSISEIAELADNNKLESCFFVNRRSNICENCGLPLENPDCPGCESKTKNFSKYSFGINAEACSKYFQMQLKQKLIDANWLEDGANLQKNNVKIRISVIASRLTMPRALELLGEAKLKDHCNELIVFVSPDFVDKSISVLEGITLRDLSGLKSELAIKELLASLDALADLSTKVTIEELDLRDIRSKKDYIYSHIKDLAVQSADGEASKQGYSFENAALTLLYSPLFPVRQLKMKNVDDGAIFYNLQDAQRLILVSVKSSKYQPFSITEAVQNQLRKYASALFSGDVSRHYHIPSYVIIVGNISEDDENNNKAIDALEREFKNKFNFVFMPLDVLIRIHKLSLEKQIYFNNMYIRIIEFLSKKRYLTIAQADELFNSLEQEEKNSFEHLAIKQIKDKVKKATAQSKQS